MLRNLLIRKDFPIVLGTPESNIPIPGIISKNINFYKNIEFNCNTKNKNEIVNSKLLKNLLSSYTPQQLRKAYGLDLLPSLNIGSDITVAIIIAYSYPNLQNDFNIFCEEYAMPTQTLNIHKMSSSISYDEGWAFEECLDVQMVHAIAPYAKIMVVEAVSNSFNNLNNAVTWAGNNGANIISMSYGSREFNSQNIYSNIYNNPNICYLASSGDLSAIVEVPSSYQNVMSIGGTSLYLDASGVRIQETTWSNGGCGISLYVNKPSYQSDLSGNKRYCCDLSLVGNPSTGVLTYFSGNWYIAGGTSVSCPLFAGMLSLINQNRKNNNKPLLTTVDNRTNNILTYLYKTIYKNNTMYAAIFYDILVGTYGKFVAKTGYDNPTGLGTPRINNLIQTLLNI